ncbi:acyl-CoA synthetase, partial [bacterium]|nr:acyl-CoA synthetase [bacterium]
AAIVVPKKGEQISEEEIIEYAKGKLAGWECPKFVRVQDSLPRNPTGKVLKYQLVESYSKITE